jgi:hypothetical protein
MSFLSFDLALVLAVYVDVYVGGFPGDHSPLPIGGNRGSTPLFFYMGCSPGNRHPWVRFRPRSGRNEMFPSRSFILLTILYLFSYCAITVAYCLSLQITFTPNILPLDRKA